MTVVAIVIECSLVNCRDFSSLRRYKGSIYYFSQNCPPHESTNPDSAPWVWNLLHFDKCSVHFEFLVLLSSGKEIDWSVRADEDSLASHHVQ